MKMQFEVVVSDPQLAEDGENTADRDVSTGVPINRLSPANGGSDRYSGAC